MRETQIPLFWIRFFHPIINSHLTYSVSGTLHMQESPESSWQYSALLKGSCKIPKTPIFLYLSSSHSVSYDFLAFMPLLRHCIPDTAQSHQSFSTGDFDSGNAGLAAPMIVSFRIETCRQALICPLLFSWGDAESLGF